MPRKTKRKKIIAEYRRRIQMVNGKRWKVDFEDKSWRVEKQNSTSNLKLQDPASTVYLPPSNFIKKDLKKTFILSTLAISLEFVLYWLMELR